MRGSSCLSRVRIASIPIMVPRLFKTLHRSIHGLHEAAYLLAVFALFSQVLALFRDRLLAHFFGAGSVLDIYYAAFRIPDFIFAFFASTVSLFVLVPFITDRLSNIERTRTFLNSIFSGFFITIVGVSIVIFFLTPQLISFLFSTFSPDVTAELVLLTRILLLSPILLGISNILASITQTHKQFLIYAIAPLLYNAGIIFGILVLRPAFGLVGLVMGVVLGALLHVLIQVPAVIQNGLLPRLVLSDNFDRFLKVIYVSLPRTLSLALNQLVLLALVAIAATMHEGSISIFNFAFNLNGVPLALIGASYSVAAFPTLTRLFTEGEHERFFAHLEAAMKHILFWSLPVAALFIVLRAHIVRVVLGSGAFNWNDTRLTAAVLALFVFSLIAHALYLLFVRSYYATGKTTRPLIINIISSTAIILFTYIGLYFFKTFPLVQYFFEHLLRVQNIPGTEVLILGAAYSLGMLVNVTLFLFVFAKDFQHSFSLSLRNTFARSLVASIVVGTITYAILDTLGRSFGLENFISVLLQGAIAGLIGAGAGVFVLSVLKSKELQEVKTALHHKFWNRKPIAPEPEEL